MSDQIIQAEDEQVVPLEEALAPYAARAAKRVGAKTSARRLLVQLAKAGVRDASLAVPLEQFSAWLSVLRVEKFSVMAHSSAGRMGVFAHAQDYEHEVTLSVHTVAAGIAGYEVPSGDKAIKVPAADARALMPFEAEAVA